MSLDPIGQSAKGLTMDDRGEGLTHDGVPDVIEADFTDLHEAQNGTAVVELRRSDSLEDALDASVKGGRDDEALLDDSLDETVVITEAEMAYLGDDAIGVEELDSATQHLDQYSVSSSLSAVEDTVVASVATQPNELGSEPKEKLWAPYSLSLSRLFRISLILIAGGAVGYALSQYQNSSSNDIAGGLFQEVAPLKGEVLLLEPEQVSYCLAQGIRLEALSKQAVGLKAAVAARLQLVYQDFDQRCADVQFDPNAYLAAKQQVDVNHGALEQQGVALLASIKLINNPVASRLADLTYEPQSQREALTAVSGQVDAEEIGVTAEVAEISSTSRESVVVSVEPTESVEAVTDDVSSVANSSIDLKPRRIVEDMQWRLFKLGLFNGSVSGVYGESTQLAVKEFYRVHEDIAESKVEREIFAAINRVYVQR